MTAAGSAIVISAIGGATHSYRAEQLAKSLIVNGLNTRVFGAGEVDHAHNVLLQEDRCAVVALVRCPLAGPFGDIVAIAKSRGIPVLADFDDLVFRADLFDPTYIDGLRYLTGSALEAYRGAVPLYRAMVTAADLCVASTRSLAAEALAAGARRVVTLPNSYTHAQAALSRALRYERGETRQSPTVVGYASGSMTHQKDFAEAAGAIAQLLSTSPTHRLRITGQLDLDVWDDLRPYRDRIDREGLRTLGEIPFIYDQFDIAIAPLQLGNPFTDAKSALKFIDATLVGVPTVASPTASYAEFTGGTELLLASSQQEWADAIMALSEDAALREALVKCALERVEEDFSPARHAAIVRQILDQVGVTTQPAKSTFGVGPHTGASASVRTNCLVWVVPPPQLGSGGMGSIFRMARELELAGHRSLVVVAGTAGMGQSAHYADEFGIEVVAEGAALPPGSRQVATHWPTAWTIAAHRGPLRPLYFIQDYEPHFYPMSYEHMRAKDSYSLPFHHVYYGPWVGAKVQPPEEVSHVSIEFPIDPEFLSPIEVARDPHAVAFLSRPDMPRRCYDFSVAVLAAVLELHPDMTVHSYGSFDVPHFKGHPRVTHHGYLNKVEMARLYRSCSFGMAVSTTNPSAVPFEMMASGCVPIDLDTEIAPYTYAGNQSVPILLPLDIDTATGVLADAVADEDAIGHRRAQALASGATRPTPAQTAAVLLEFIRQLPD